MDFFRILGVSHDSSNEEIKKAYLDLAKVWHPDRNADHDATRRFKMIQEAYENLKTPDKRAIYLRDRGEGDAGDDWVRARRRNAGYSGGPSHGVGAKTHNVGADFDRAVKDQSKRHSRTMWKAMNFFEYLIHPKILFCVVVPVAMLTSWGMSSVRTYLNKQTNNESLRKKEKTKKKK